MTEKQPWEATLSAGPLDGATLGLDVGADELPRHIVVNLAVGEDPTEEVWHSYVLDRSSSTFRYLGEDDLAGMAGAPGPADGSAGGSVGGEMVVDGRAVSKRFYELLFERHPAVRSLFSADMDHQSAMLHTTMRAVLEHLDDPEWLIRTLGTLGVQHAEWGVTPAMYAAFTDCMVSAMAEALGVEWSPALEASWRGTLDDIGTVMLVAASTVE